MPGSDVALARSTVAVAVRAGAPKPDIGSVKSFKQAMLKARSIAYADPARGGASGTHFARVLERLGIAEQVNSKAKLIPGFGAVAAVARGEVEIAISQTMEILRDSGADLVGPLPAELQNTTDFVMVAAVPATAREPARAKAFMQFLLGEVARSVFKSKGMEPEGP